MPDNLNKKVLLVGSGLMAQEYAKVLTYLEISFDVVGRGIDSAEAFTSKINKPVITGGIENLFNNGTTLYSHAIVTTGIDHLCSSATTLLKNNIVNILLEKPGGINSHEIEKICELASTKKADVLIAYNRRFYASTLNAEKIIETDGGVSSFHFEFTEWSHVIEPLKTPIEIKNKWFLANSTHVADLAFFLGGNPIEISCYKGGSLSWHAHSKFAGAGMTVDNAVFSYHANWASPGRWSLEILTAKHRLYFKPMESLQVQELGKVSLAFLEIEDQLDKDFKPGLFLQTKSFLQNDYKRFCTIYDQLEFMNWYNKMSGYESV